jgi:hypothetical protein
MKFSSHAALVAMSPGPGGAGLSAEEGLAIGSAFREEVLPTVRPLRQEEDIYDIVLVHLNSILSRYENAAQVRQQCPQLEPLIIWVLVNSNCPEEAIVDTALPSLTADEASEISKSFNAFLLHKKMQPRMAVSSWIDSYPSLVELSTSEPFFRPMIETVAGGLYKNAKFQRSYIKLSIGATLSILDMVSDIIVIIAFKGTEEFEKEGNLLLGMLIANLTMQLIVVYGQNRTAPRSVLFWEVVYTVTCVKAGVDAYRVATGAEQESYNAFDPKMELGEYNDAAI